MASASFTQTRFRIRNDDGNETTATWKAAENTNQTLNTASRFRVRIQVDETASVAWTSVTWNLRYSLNGGAYTAVSGTTPVQFSASANFADGDDSTSQLTAATGTFVANNNAMKETTGGAVNSGTSGQYFDSEWSLILDAAQLTQADTIGLRIYNGTSAIAAYTQTPTITVQKVTNGTLTQTLANVTVSATGTGTINGALAQTLGALSLTATGTGTVNGALAQTLGALTVSATGTVADTVTSGALAVTLDALALQASGTSTEFGTADVTLDSLSLDATGTVADAAAVAESVPAVGRPRRRVLYQVEVNGETEYYGSPEAAEAALRAAFKRAKNVAQTTRRMVKHVPTVAPVPAPVIAANDALQDSARQYMAMLARMYEQIEADRQATLAEIDDEEILLLL